ncbi:MAG: hypothetical protein U9Q98_07880 [Bacteroidota bacterium]|nr:hypothetical protein [Bacteroidota bacterium]
MPYIPFYDICPLIAEKETRLNNYDHIIRDDTSCHRIKNYIINNPKNWTNDKYYFLCK